MTGTATKNGLAQQTNGAANPREAEGGRGSGRDAGGRFVPGNKLGTGNPFARLVAGMRLQLVHRVTAADLDAVVDHLVHLAKGGDLGAIKLLLGYLVGKPAEVVNPDTLDLEEWQARPRLPDEKEAEAVMARVPFDLLSVAANAIDGVQREIAREMSRRARPVSRRRREARRRMTPRLGRDLGGWPGLTVRKLRLVYGPELRRLSPGHLTRPRRPMPCRAAHRHLTEFRGSAASAGRGTLAE